MNYSSRKKPTKWRFKVEYDLQVWALPLMGNVDPKIDQYEIWLLCFYICIYKD